ncbi:MAG: hypothetical protein M3P26_08600 [Gemmatimonadota bacterium]|nr:hypothetical protein [Gemmatimonadota bacterium]
MDDLLEDLRKSFADSYHVDEELKGGGMSRLFMATDLALNRKVVIKIPAAGAHERHDGRAFQTDSL